MIMNAKCKSCKKFKPILAKGLCRSCYIKNYRKMKQIAGICVNCYRDKIDLSHSKWYCTKCLYRINKKIELKRAIELFMTN